MTGQQLSKSSAPFLLGLAEVHDRDTTHLALLWAEGSAYDPFYSYAYGMQHTNRCMQHTYHPLNECNYYFNAVLCWFLGLTALTVVGFCWTPAI